MFEDLKDKRILIVGASQGIGKNLVECLSRFQPNIYIASRSIEKLNDIASKNGPKIKAIELDLLDEKSFPAILERIEPLDGLCILTGALKLIPPKLLNRKLIDDQLAINLSAPISFLGAVLKKNLLKDGASVIFTSSSGRHNQASSSAPYAASKIGLYGATKSLAADLSKKKIRVNCVSFDYVETDMTSKIDMSLYTKGIVDISPVEYTAIPYIFLLSDFSSWITGQIIAADAGRMLTKTRYV
jgi:3-oxoacyl-[acyl-carrier protein] reductase